MVTHEDAEKLMVTMADFEHALTYDIKPAFGISDDQLDSYVFNGEVESYRSAPLVSFSGSPHTRMEY